MAIEVTSPFGAITGLEPVNNNEGKSNTNREIMDKCGSVVDAETIETIGRPTCTYNVVADCDLSQVILGQKITGNIVPTNLQVTSGAGQPPQVTITGEDVGATAAQIDETNIVTPSGTITPDLCAQEFGSLPDSTATCHLQSCTATWSVELTRVNGDDGKIAAWGISKGKLEASAEYQSTDTSAPVAPAATPTLVVTTPANKAGDNTNLPKYTLATTTYL
jgi:hypothetical protein